jgi:hypothetical protein
VAQSEAEAKPQDTSSEAEQRIVGETEQDAVALAAAAS